MADPFRIVGSPLQPGLPQLYGPDYPQPTPVPLPPEQDNTSYLPAFLGGSAAGNAFKNSYNWGAIQNAEAAYRLSYNNVINLGSTGSAILYDAAQGGLSAMNASLKEYGVDINDLYGSYLSKATNFLIDKSSSSAPKSFIDPSKIAEMVKRNDDIGDYVVRVMKNSRLTDAQNATLGRDQLAWFTPLQDLAGLKLDQESILRAVGYDLETIQKSLPGDYSLAVYRTSDLKAANLELEVPTWDNIIKKAKASEDFNTFSKTYGSDFFDELRSINYPEFSEIYSRNGWSYETPEVQQFLDGLSPRDQNLYKARAAIEKQYGATSLFLGEGYTLDPSGEFAVRELVAPNEKVIKTPPHALLELKQDGSSTIVSTSAEAPPNRLIFSKDSAKGGAIGAFSAIATGFYDDLQAYRAGKLSAEEWISKAPGRIFQDGGYGFGSGVAENAIELSTTQKILQRFGTGKSLLGQSLRQIPGSGVAGGVISLGTSLIDQIGQYRAGTVSGPDAIGNVAGETVIGTTSAIAGSAAGAATLGLWGGGSAALTGLAAVGSIATGIGAGVAIGYAADYTLRYFGVDKKIADWTSDAAEGIQYFASDTWERAKVTGDYLWDGTKYYSGAAWDGTKAAASYTWDGVKSGASTAWGATTSVAGGVADWTMSWFE